MGDEIAEPSIMARSRTVILTLLAVTGVLVFASGSGAFTAVSAQRTVSVSTASDSNALLQLTNHSGPNGQYASETDGELEITLDNANLNASTTLNDVFNITNQGTQTVGVWIVKSGQHSDLVTFENATGSAIDNSSSAAQTLGVGNTIQVTIAVNTTGQNLAANTTLLNSVEIHADAAEA